MTKGKWAEPECPSRLLQTRAAAVLPARGAVAGRRVRAASEGRAPLLPAPPAARGLGAAGGGAQALGLFRMSSTSASTISRTSSWDPRERAVGASGASVPLCWGHRRPHPHPGHPVRPAAGQAGTLPRGRARTSRGPTVQRTLTSKATRGFQFSFCFALVQSPCRKSYRAEGETGVWVAVCARTPARPRPPAPGAPAALLGVSAPRAALALGAVNLVKSGGVPRGGQEVTAARASAEAPWL